MCGSCSRGGRYVSVFTKLWFTGYETIIITLTGIKEFWLSYWLNISSGVIKEKKSDSCWYFNSVWYSECLVIIQWCMATINLPPNVQTHSGFHRRSLWPGWLGGLDQLHWKHRHPGGWRRPHGDQPHPHWQGCGEKSLQLPAAEGQPDWNGYRVFESVSLQPETEQKLTSSPDPDSDVWILYNLYKQV